MPTQRCPCLDDPYDSIGRRAGAREHGAAERLVRPGGPVPEPQVDSVVVAHLKGIMYFNAGASSARAFLGASAEEPQMQLRYGMNPHQAAPIESAQWGAVLHQPARRPERVATRPARWRWPPCYPRRRRSSRLEPYRRHQLLDNTGSFPTALLAKGIGDYCARLSAAD